MIVDSSALISILRFEADAAELLEIIEAASAKRMSVANFVETAIVVDRSPDPIAGRKFDELCTELRLDLVPVDEKQARIARDAYRDFGRGSGHPARLNFGDCFAYALAKARGEPLLFKGDDFSHTDVRSAL